jgi:hypothetical protein
MSNHPDLDEEICGWDIAEESLETHIFPKNEKHEQSKNCCCDPLLEYKQLDGHEVWIHFPLGGK